MSPRGRRVRIRMYDVGFGDCFLLFVPTDDGEEKTVLVDCGTINKSKLAIRDVAEALIADLSEEFPGRERPRIDVVVASHRHKDHVSGFAGDVWRGVEVGEVWLPWMEGDDPEARRIRTGHLRLAEALQAHALRLAGVDGAGASDLDPVAFAARASAAGALAADRKRRLSRTYALAFNALGNEKAMKNLRDGFANRPELRFFPKDERDRRYETPLLPGVQVSILGPSRDPAVIRREDPPPEQTYRHLLGLDGADDRTSDPPFRPHWAVGAGDRRIRRLEITPAERAAIEKIDAGAEERLAYWLDDALNGTSLVLVLEIGRARLLLPGDAQWGTWERILADQEWRELLASTSFLKVGHHGSHNATPKDLVDEDGILGRDFGAMVSVRAGTSDWEDVPLPELLAAIAKRTRRIARSDEPEGVDTKHFKVGPDARFIETSVPV